MDTVSTPTTAAEAKYCVGCGVDIHSKKINERRPLCSEAGRNIKAIWEEIISMKLSQSGRELDLESFVGTLQNREYMPFPGRFEGGGKTAWYRLFTHARNIPFIQRIFS